MMKHGGAEANIPKGYEVLRTIDQGFVTTTIEDGAYKIVAHDTVVNGRPVEVRSQIDAAGNGSLFYVGADGSPVTLPDRPIVMERFQHTEDGKIRTILIGTDVYMSSRPDPATGNVAEEQFFPSRASLIKFDTQYASQGWRENYGYTNVKSGITTIVAGAANPGWEKLSVHVALAGGNGAGGFSTGSLSDIQHAVHNPYPYGNEQHDIVLVASRVVELTWWHEENHFLT